MDESGADKMAMFADALPKQQSMLMERRTGVWMYDGFARIFITFAGLLDI